VLRQRAAGAEFRKRPLPHSSQPAEGLVLEPFTEGFLFLQIGFRLLAPRALGGDFALYDLLIFSDARVGVPFPKGPRARSGNGGWHLLYRHQPGITNSKNKLGPGIDVKSTGGYILVAPSWTMKSDAGPGGQYIWEVSPFDADVPPLPIWLTTILNPPPRPTPPFVLDARGGDIEPLARFVASSPQGERNNRLFWAACRARELGIRSALAEHRLSQAAAAAGLSSSALRHLFTVPSFGLLPRNSNRLTVSAATPAFSASFSRDQPTKARAARS
jgi:hypothetical protein